MAEPLQPSKASSNFPAEQFVHLAAAGTSVNDALSADEPGAHGRAQYLSLSEKLKIRDSQSRTNYQNKYFYKPYGLSKTQTSLQTTTRFPGWRLPQFIRYEEQRMIPRAILNHVQTASALTLKGLLPEIGRAWISVDSTLYLWNYDASDIDGSAAYNIYSELDQVITSVAVVLPRKDTFQDFISHVLVIATTVEIVLVGVERHGNRVKDPVHLHPTALRCSTDGVRINKIVGTFEGRIFLAGSDSYVYEFQYSQDSWRRYFGYKCVKRNMSASFASYLVPQTVLEYMVVDPIIDIVVDNSRQLLYTLSRLQIIAVYDLGNDGESFAFRHALQPLAEAARQFAKRTQTADQPQDTECKKFKSLKDWVVSIHVIPVVESNDVHLVAVTRNCMRIYLTTQKPPRRKNNRNKGTASTGLPGPDNLSIVSIRLPPPTKFPQEGGGNKRPTGNDTNAMADEEIGIPGSKPSMASPFTRGGSGGQWNNVRKCISTSRLTVVVDKHKDLDAYDTLSAFCQDSAHEAYARDDPKNHNGIRGGAPSNPGLCESVHSYQLQTNNTSMGRVEALAIAHSFVSEIDDIMRIKPVLSTQRNTGGAAATKKSNSSSSSSSSSSAASKRKRDNSNDATSLTSARSNHPSVINLDILATQHRTPPELLLCLTSRALSRFVQLQPVDQLYRLFCHQEDQFEEEITQFHDLYGTRETCAMCLIICCAPIAARGARLMTNNMGVGDQGGIDGPSVGLLNDSDISVDGEPQAKTRAEISFMALGQVLDNQGSTRTQRGGGGGGGGVGGGRRNAQGVSIADEQTYSGRYHGMRQFLARILRPLWKWSVTVSELKTDGSPERFGSLGVVDRVSNKIQKISQTSTGFDQTKGWQQLRFSRHKLETLHKPLESFRRLLERNATRLGCEQLPSHSNSNNNNNGSPVRAARMNGGGGGGRNLNASARRDIAERQESHRVAELYRLVIRASQALTVLRILASNGNHFPRIVQQCSNSVQINLKNMTFEELVTTSSGATTLKILISKLMSEMSNRGTNMRRMCIDLKRQCPMFFSEGDTLRMTGRDLIRRAIRAGSERVRERRDLLVEALRELVKSCESLQRRNPDKHLVESVCDVCKEFCQSQLSFYDGVVSLALSCAYHLAHGKTQHLPVMFGIGSTDGGGNGGGNKVDERTLRLQLRQKCYTCILDMFKGLIFHETENVNEFSVSELPPEQSMNALRSRHQGIVQHLLERCQAFQDLMFHDMLYTWLYDKNQKYLYERIETPQFVEQWLTRKGGELPYDYFPSLVHFYVNQNRLMEAGNVCAVLAKEQVIDNNYPLLEERIKYLTEAIYYVKAAQQNRLLSGHLSLSNMVDYVSGEGLSSLQRDYLVAVEQKHLLEKLEKTQGNDRAIWDSNNDRVTTLQQLMKNLIPEDPLYEIAKKRKCWDRCLSIIQTIGTDRPSIVSEIQYAWVNIFRLAYLDVKRKTAGMDCTRDGRANPERNIFMHWDEIQTSLRSHVMNVGKVLWQQNELHIAITMNDKIDYLTAMLELGSYYSIAVDSDPPNPESPDYFIEMKKRLWCVDLLHGIGIPFSKILDTYETFLKGTGGQYELQEAMNVYNTWFPKEVGHVRPEGVDGHTLEKHVRLVFKHYVDKVMVVLQQANSLGNNPDINEEFLFKLENLIYGYLQPMSQDGTDVGRYMTNWIQTKLESIRQVKRKLANMHSSELTHNMGF